MTIKPPPQQVEVPLVHRICELYKKFYLLSSKLPKKHKLGIFMKIENICLDVTQLIITAALESKNSKLPLLNTARIKIELMKKLIRITNELNIVPNSKYLELELDLQEISKMTNGWIKYLNAVR